MKRTLLTILQYVIFLGLGIWIVYHMIHQLKPQEETDLLAAIKSINAWYLIPIGIVGFLSHFFRAIRWRYLLETVGMKPSLANTTLAVLIGYITNLALPRAGEVAKCTVLAKYEKIPAHKMIGTIVAERAFDIFCLIVIAIGAFLLQIGIISDYVSGKMHLLGESIHRHETLLLIILGFIIALFVTTVLVYRRHRETKVGRFIKEMAHGVLSIFHMKKRWKFIGYTGLIWLMYLMQIYIGLMSLPDTHHLTPLAALVILVYGSVGMIITPGGIGMYTLMVAQILAVYNIPDIPAEAFGWIAWAVQTAIIILLGVTSFILIHPLNSKRIRTDAQVAVDTK
jgi:glycosyltransferase 2 family protein